MNPLNSGPTANLLQASLENSRIQQVQHADTQNVQSHAGLKQLKEDERKRKQVGQTQKSREKTVQKEKHSRTGKEEETTPSDRGVILDIRA